MADQEFYTRAEKAQQLRVHVKTISRYVQSGRLRAVRVGRKMLFPKNEAVLLEQNGKKRRKRNQ